ncbi:hypothetical protein [Rhizocola hellebori]|nr:hypothetical protein [Rhizocola hellebori]
MLRRLILLVVLGLAVTSTPVTPQTTATENSDLGEGSGPAHHVHRPATLPVSVVAQQAVAPMVAQTCADGTLSHDEVGGAAGVALGNLQVQLWDQDSSSADDLLDANLTAASGAFLLCSATDDLDDSANNGLDIYVRVVTENGFWRVDDVQAYQFSLALWPNVAAGTTVHYGATKPGAGTPQAGALQIFNAVDRLWAWTGAQQANDCWDSADKQPSDYSKCRQVAIEWRPDSSTRGFYDSALNRVHLAAVDFKWRDSVVREAAKAVMDDIFEDDYPDPSACGDRTLIGKVTSASCAWAEGFADWVATQVYADPVLDWQIGAQVFHENLETPGWETPGWGYGDAVEARVAGALIDLSDATNETPWDRLAQGPTPLWSKVLTHSWTPGQRYRALADLGFSGDNALATLYQNTIDYGLRDPLSNGAAVVRRTPLPPHNFRYSTTTRYWSVMAIRPPQAAAPTADYDLKLFADEAMAGSPLVTSAAGSAASDFIVIDSNLSKHPLGTYYPQVYRYSASTGSGQYDARFVQASSNVAIGQSVSSSAVPVSIWETTVAASAQVKIEVTQAAGQDAELFLFCSTTSASSWVRSRSAASATAPALAGGTETLLWTAPAIAPGYCAIVLINKLGSGAYTVTRKS